MPRPVSDTANDTNRSSASTETTTRPPSPVYRWALVIRFATICRTLADSGVVVLAGDVREDLAEEVVRTIRDRDGNWTYQFAATVDDSRASMVSTGKGAWAVPSRSARVACTDATASPSR